MRGVGGRQERFVFEKGRMLLLHTLGTDFFFVEERGNKRDASLPERELTQHAHLA